MIQVRSASHTRRVVWCLIFVGLQLVSEVIFNAHIVSKFGGRIREFVKKRTPGIILTQKSRNLSEFCVGVDCGYSQGSFGCLFLLFATLFGFVLCCAHKYAPAGTAFAKEAKELDENGTTCSSLVHLYLKVVDLV